MCGFVSPGADFSLDGNELVRNSITMKGVYNYHPRNLVQALDFVIANRARFPFAEIVDSKFSLDQLDKAFSKAEERSVLRAAIVP
jgi:alcohol dehydrogenase